MTSAYRMRYNVLYESTPIKASRPEGCAVSRPAEPTLLCSMCRYRSGQFAKKRFRSVIDAVAVWLVMCCFGMLLAVFACLFWIELLRRIENEGAADDATYAVVDSSRGRQRPKANGTHAQTILHKAVERVEEVSSPGVAVASQSSSVGDFSRKARSSTPQRRRTEALVVGQGVVVEQSPSAFRFDSIESAIQDVAAGRFVVVLDDEHRENEGDLIAAAELVTTESIAFMVEHTSGVICVGMKGEDLDRLQLPLMVPPSENTDAKCTAFTVTVDLRDGTTTGISASDRAKTLQALSRRQTRPSDLRRPGHIFPLRCEEGGVVCRRGHTEASVDLAILAGCRPAGVLSEIVNRVDGSMARTPQLFEFARRYGLKIITIEDLVEYRQSR